eukprot:SM000008S22338  [mRNA]  locus=s8:1174332:1176251:+ [translate_table: standard]
MSKKRGLSLEEKRDKLLEIFYETKDFFLLKELERLGPKKGVISQAVKDVLQALVDDDLVMKDKIGTSVYFWSLPSLASKQLQQSVSKHEGELAATKNKKAELEEQLENMKSGREESADRKAALARLSRLLDEEKSLKAEIFKYAEHDPEVFARKRDAIKVAHDATNRWTDNIFAMQHWCNTNYPDSREKLASAYEEIGIVEDLDYVS